MSWFERLFGRRGADTPAPAPAPAPAAAQASAPVAPAAAAAPQDFNAARHAGREALGAIMAAIKDQRGIHLESLFCALGAVAGRACQDSVRARALAEGKPADAYFAVATTQDGGKFYFGDALNQPLAEDRVSVWSLVAGAAAHDGAQRLPDLTGIFKHNATVLGGPQFGLPRLPPEHPVQSRPVEYADRLWPMVKPLLARYLTEPRMWPVALGLAIQEAMEQTRGRLPPDMVALIVMESAIPVSKIPIRD